MSKITKESKIEMLGLESRINKALHETVSAGMDIDTVGDLIEVLDRKGLSVLKAGQSGGIARFGKKSLDKVLGALEEAGFEIPERLRPWWQRRWAYRLRKIPNMDTADEAIVKLDELTVVLADLLSEHIRDRLLLDSTFKVLRAAQFLADEGTIVTLEAKLLARIRENPAEWRKALGLEPAGGSIPFQIKGG